MIEIHPLAFQEELLEITTQVRDLAGKVHQESDLAEALDRVEAILEPFAGNVEWREPVSLQEMGHFRSYLNGMKL
jgi:hypothetical protein